MEEHVAAFAQVMTVIVVSLAGFVAIGLGTRWLWRLGSRTNARSLPADDSRLVRLENAIETIAIEVERISEGQRFAVALLSDRLPARGEDRAGELPPASARRAITPH